MSAVDLRKSAGMDSELRRLVQSVKSGAIRDPEQVRHILADANSAIDKVQHRMWKIKDLIRDAEEAFLKGWPAIESSA